MKKITFFFICLLIGSILAGCNLDQANAQNNSIVIQSAYNSLSKEEKTEIGEKWNTAKVNQATLNQRTVLLFKQEYIGKKVYEVIFASKKANVLGDIKVYIAEDKKTIVAKGLRD